MAEETNKNLLDVDGNELSDECVEELSNGKGEDDE